MKLKKLSFCWKGYTASYPGKDEVLYFLVGRYQNGFVLAFYTHSPWGHCRDQEQGWAIIDARNRQVVDEIESRTYGKSTGEYLPWKRKMSKQYGKIKYILQYPGGPRVNTITGN